MKTMKTMTLMLIIMTVLINSSIADDGKYIATMQKNIQALYQAQSVPEFQTSVNAFERIAAVEKTKWEPHYYAAFGYLMMTAKEQDAATKDLYIDKAMEAVEKAKSIAGDDSEVIALEGFALMMRVSVDPASRGPRFAGLSVQAFEKALKLNPENPRALTLLAQMQFGTAKFFGSAPTEACETLNKALGKFDSFESKNQLAPRWGMQMALGLKSECK